MTVVPTSAEAQQRAAAARVAAAVATAQNRRAQAAGSVAADRAQAILALLADGQPHTVRELHALSGYRWASSTSHILGACCAKHRLERVNLGHPNAPRWGYRLPQGSERSGP